MDQISMKTPSTKFRLFLKIDQLRYLAAGVYLSESQNPPMIPYSPPPHTHCIRVFSILIHTGKREGGQVNQ
jgi:hypothetical protein